MNKMCDIINYILYFPYSFLMIMIKHEINKKLIIIMNHFSFRSVFSIWLSDHPSHPMSTLSYVINQNRKSQKIGQKA